MSCRWARRTSRRRCPAYTPVVHAGGLTFRVAKLPGLRFAEPASMVVNVTDAAGKPVTFTPFYGALAHAIFFRQGTLDYFHSHICGNDPACTRGLRDARHDGPQHEARAPRARRAAAGDGRVAAVPPGRARRQAADRSVYAEGAMRRREHLAGFCLGLVLVVLGGRALAYAATPTPLAAQLGGPRLPVITFVALALAALLSLGVLWLAALGVRERHALDRAPGPAPAPRRWRASARRRPARRRLAARLRRARDLDALARRHAHALVDVPRGAGAPQRHSDPARALARGCGAARRPAPRARVGAPRRRACCGGSCSRAPHGGRRRSSSGTLTAPAWLLARALRARGPPALSIP